MPSKYGEAGLARDGSVKWKGREVGVWWVDGNDLYCFAESLADVTDCGQKAIAASTHKEHLREKVTAYLKGEPEAY
ncbi:MAG: hypothetical protein DI626_04970 [Micavibrio aeruginosavorus]|uniref:Uncharacterized protein n=1 Tax=Micavibrio aeruginosavorus TaxID=349221 RepID=A0A2W4ZXK0_9BACT|nr:MAG: hypothetical protein DI626_04970 [Micavibrio aeruginosavorus]